jgi:hypothetical protein
MGTRDNAGGWFWRLVCPISWMPVQMVFLDPASKLFVSREAYGREPGKKIALQVEFHVGLLTQISDLCQRLTKRPPPKETPVGLNNFGLDFGTASFTGSPSVSSLQ